MTPPDQKDEQRRRTEEAYARQDQRDNFFRCGGYEGMPAAENKEPKPDLVSAKSK